MTKPASSLCDRSLDDNTGEEYVWKFEIGATGSKKCFWRQTFDDINPDFSPGWDINFSTTKSEIQVEVEMYEKDADGDPCTWNLGQDDEGQRGSEIQRYTIGNMAEGSSFGWTSGLQMPDDDGACYMRASGTITRLTSDTAVRTCLTPITAPSPSCHDNVGEWDQRTPLLFY